VSVTRVSRETRVTQDDVKDGRRNRRGGSGVEVVVNLAKGGAKILGLLDAQLYNRLGEGVEGL
jgi:hypothetical protein